MGSDYGFYITPAEYEKAALIGIGRRLLDSRVREHGWDKERAITTPPRKTNERAELLKVAISNGISSDCFYRRVVSLKWSIEDAITKPLIKPEKTEKYSEEIKDVAKKNNIKPHTLRARIRKGWTPEEASTIPIFEKRRDL